MPLSELKEVLRRSDEKPNPTARDKKVGAMLIEKLLEPVASRLKSVGLEVESMGQHSSTKPHHISELTLVAPTREQLIPQLRIALTQMKKGEEVPLSCSLGVTVCQRSDTKEGTFPPNVRWGLWCDSPHAKSRLPGPFRILAAKMEWEGTPTMSRPMNNMARGWLSMIGRERTVEALDEYGSIDELADQIAQDLVGLANVMKAS